MTLTLPPVLLELLLADCHRRHPREACGVLPGRDDRPERVVPMSNVSDKPTRRFAFDVEQQMELWEDMDEDGEDPIVIYHSHTASQPEPSGTDRAHFTNPNIHYVIVSTSDAPGDWPRVRSWRWVDGGLVEEAVVVAARCG